MRISECVDYGTAPAIISEQYLSFREDHGLLDKFSEMLIDSYQQKRVSGKFYHFEHYYLCLYSAGDNASIHNLSMIKPCLWPCGVSFAK